MELLWEAFNLFNKTNIVEVDNDAFNFDSGCTAPTGAANFQGCLTPRNTFLGVVSTGNTLYGARQMQFGAKFRF